MPNTKTKMQMGSGFLFAIIIFLAPFSFVSAQTAYYALDTNGTSANSPVDGVVWGMSKIANPATAFTTNFQSALVVPADATITQVAVYSQVSGTLGSPESAVVELAHYRNGVSISTTTITSAFTFTSANNVHVASGLSVPVLAGDQVFAIITMPTWATNPTGVAIRFSALFEYPIDSSTATTTISVDNEPQNLFNGVILFVVGFWSTIWFFRKRV